MNDARLALLLLNLSFIPATVNAGEVMPFSPQEIPAATYDRAAGLLSRNLQGTVRNAEVAPHWIGQRDELWYRRDTQSGTEYVIVDARSGRRRPAFDHERLAAALSKLTATHIDPARLGIMALAFDTDLTSLELRTTSTSARCGLTRYDCEASPWRHDPFQNIGPDGRSAAFRRGHDIWLRDLADGSERRLSDDGEEHYGYGSLPSLAAKLKLLRQGLEAGGPLVGASWSPDATKLIVPKVDERQVGEYAYLESLPADGATRPRVLSKRLALLGDEHVSRFELFVFHVSSGERRSIPLPADCYGELGALPPLALWSADAAKAFVICQSPDGSRVELVEYDPASGRSRSAFEETATWIDLNHSLYQSLGANVRIIEDGRRAVWFSERDGWGHLYLVDLHSGKVLRQLTRGEWVVQDLLHVEEQDGWVYYTAGGREPDRNPYWRHVYRSSLDGKRTELLTPELADHAVTSAAPGASFGAASTFSPSGRYFVDNYSTIEVPAISLLRRDDSSVVTTLEKADASVLYARGYEPPQAFTVMAADGKTPLYGVIYKPKNLRPDMKYPVIEHIYGGPQTNITPRTFTRAAGLEVFGGQGDTASMTEMGFAVVMMDVRGTPWRSKKFHDYTWKKHHEFAIEDHVAALKQLGERYDWLDLDRVGITGHSWGGSASALAMLRFPELYKVGVSSAGAYDYHYLYLAFTQWIGRPEYESGGRIAPTPNARTTNVIPHAALVENLQGKLLIVYGEHDENTLPPATLTFVNALIEAGKDFDLLMLPNRDHWFTHEPYFIRRRWDYFVRHLLGARPPESYRIRDN